MRVKSGEVCCDCAETLIKLFAYEHSSGPIGGDTLEMVLAIAQMSDRQIAHILRKQDDTVLAVMVRTLASACLQKHGNKKHKQVLERLHL